MIVYKYEYEVQEDGTTLTNCVLGKCRIESSACVTCDHYVATEYYHNRVTCRANPERVGQGSHGVEDVCCHCLNPECDCDECSYPNWQVEELIAQVKELESQFEALLRDFPDLSKWSKS
jgi:hypothetical protein